MTITSTGADVTLALRRDQDIAASRQLVRRVAQELGFSLVDQTKLVNADKQVGLRVSFVDEGPGIPAIEQAMADGWSTGGGLGLGLSGAKRLVNDFDIQSQVGKGTRVTITRWRAA